MARGDDGVAQEGHIEPFWRRERGLLWAGVARRNPERSEGTQEAANTGEQLEAQVGIGLEALSRRERSGSLLPQS
jgi:hypothetical protein